MKNLPSSELPFNSIESDPLDSPPKFSHKTIELQFLSSIKDNFNFHKANADKIAADAIKTFDDTLKMKIFTDQERIEFIKTKCNEIADFLCSISSNRWLATLLKKERRDTDLAERISEVEDLSDNNYHRSINIDRENSGKQVLPLLMNATTLNDAFIGLNKIWGYQMYYEYLKGLLAPSTEPKFKKDNDNTDAKSNLAEQGKTNIGSLRLVHDIVPKLHGLLLPYFTHKENDGDDLYKGISAELLKALYGKPLEEKLLFKGRATHFVYVFRELCEHKMEMDDNRRAITFWILNNFRFEKGPNKIPTDFKDRSVYRVLTGKGRNVQVPINPIDLNSIIKKT